MTPPKPDAPGLVRVCLAFPDVYEVGMSYLGFQIFHALLKSLPQADPERAYCPWPDMEAELRSRGKVLGTLETDRPLGAFDVLAFTLQYELSYTNLLTMLDLGGCPCTRRTGRRPMPWWWREAPAPLWRNPWHPSWMPSSWGTGRCCGPPWCGPSLV